MLLYFSTWLFPSAARGCRRGNSTWMLPHVETFGLSLLTLRVNGALPTAARDRETQMEEEEKPQAQQECLRVAVEVPRDLQHLCPHFLTKPGSTKPPLVWHWLCPEPLCQAPACEQELGLRGPFGIKMSSCPGCGEHRATSHRAQQRCSANANAKMPPVPTLLQDEKVWYLVALVAVAFLKVC